jgi:hypothetical protein
VAAIRHDLMFMLASRGLRISGRQEETIATPGSRIHGHSSRGQRGIAGKQTGIYPIDCPGGCQLIGRTLRSFDPLRTPTTLIQAGDWVRFEAVDDRPLCHSAEPERTASFPGRRKRGERTWHFGLGSDRGDSHHRSGSGVLGIPGYGHARAEPWIPNSSRSPTF